MIAEVIEGIETTADEIEMMGLDVEKETTVAVMKAGREEMTENVTTMATNVETTVEKTAEILSPCVMLKNNPEIGNYAIDS